MVTPKHIVTEEEIYYFDLRGYLVVRGVLTDEEIKQVDRVVRQTTVEKFGPVRRVRPTLVFELGFEGIQASTRHKSGIAVRFPRMLRMRGDKPLHEADTLGALRLLMEEAG